jgi:hypothetical protein
VEEALNGEDAKKWEMAMQEEYDSLVVFLGYLKLVAENNAI